jgi:5'(3')-deoxyribonucleotidase
MNKKILILKQQETQITATSKYITIKNIYDDLVISFLHIKAIYLNKSIKVDISTCYEISKKVPLFIIDHNGYILAELKKVEDEKI